MNNSRNIKNQNENNLSINTPHTNAKFEINKLKMNLGQKKRK